MPDGVANGVPDDVPDGVTDGVTDGASGAEALRPPGLSHGRVETRLVDARRFLELTAHLRELYDRVDAAKVSPEQKGRWHRRLIAITDSAKEDLERAQGHLVRFTAELDRHLRR